MKVTVIVQYYNDQNEERQREIDECLKNNLENPAIDHVYNLVEPGMITPERFTNHPKFTDVKGVCKGRLTYGEAFEFANVNLKDCIVALINADIYLDHDKVWIEGLETDLDGNRRVMCLSRHETNFEGKVWTTDLFMSGWSQDAWIFKAPVKIHPQMFEYPVGNCPGCDNLTAGLWRKVGYDVLNMGLKYKIYHLDRCRKEGLPEDAMVMTDTTNKYAWKAENQRQYYNPCPFFPYDKMKSGQTIGNGNACGLKIKHTHDDFIKDNSTNSGTTPAVPERKILPITENISEEMFKLAGGHVSTKWDAQTLAFNGRPMDIEVDIIFKHCPEEGYTLFNKLLTRRTDTLFIGWYINSEMFNDPSKSDAFIEKYQDWYTKTFKQIFDTKIKNKTLYVLMDKYDDKDYSDEKSKWTQRIKNFVIEQLKPYRQDPKSMFKLQYIDAHHYSALKMLACCDVNIVENDIGYWGSYCTFTQGPVHLHPHYLEYLRKVERPLTILPPNKRWEFNIDEHFMIQMAKDPPFQDPEVKGDYLKHFLDKFDLEPDARPLQKYWVMCVLGEMCEFLPKDKDSQSGRSLLQRTIKEYPTLIEGYHLMASKYEQSVSNGLIEKDKHQTILKLALQYSKKACEITNPQYVINPQICETERFELLKRLGDAVEL